MLTPQSKIKRPKGKFVAQFLFYLLPAISISAIVIVTFHLATTRSNREILETREIANIELEQDVIADDFQAVIGDLAVLANSPLLADFLASPNKQSRHRLEKLFINLATSKKIYNQLRYIDMTGEERIRVNFSTVKTTVVPAHKLQNKRSRYYFAATLKLTNGEVYISPMDLNIENGTIEQPLRPMIRFSAPVFDAAGKKCGIIILNFFGKHIIQHLQQRSIPVLADDNSSIPPKSSQYYPSTGASGHTMLVNGQGFWLLAPDPTDEWGFMLGHNRTFSQRYPTAWAEISAVEQGQVRTRNGLFSFTTIKPLANLQPSTNTSNMPGGHNPLFLEHDDFFWKLISFVSSNELATMGQQSKRNAITLFAALLFLITPASWQMAKIKTYRAETENTIRKNEEKFRTVSDFTYAWEYWVNPAGAMIYVSPSVERISGYRPEEFIDNPKLLSDIIHPDDRGKVSDHINDEINDPNVCHMEFRIITKDGQKRWILHTCQPVVNKAGENIGRRGSNHDISRRKEGDLDRERLIKKLKEALAKVKTLSGFLPICASCKKIRDDKGYWNQIELYIRDHSEAEFSHSICPDCAKKLYPEIYGKISMEKNCLKGKKSPQK